MRHKKHKYQLGVKSAHREALMASLASALFTHGRIQTTLAKAKALRPFAEKIITYAKKAALAENVAQKVHFRRLAIARVRDPKAVKRLFLGDDKASLAGRPFEGAKEFVARPGGYTRIYKLGARIGDASEMALIELIRSDDEGHPKSKKGDKAAQEKSRKKKAKKAPAKEENTTPEASSAEA
jgi:large subunit ribosomal protein L17